MIDMMETGVVLWEVEVMCRAGVIVGVVGLYACEEQRLFQWLRAQVGQAGRWLVLKVGLGETREGDMQGLRVSGVV